jgi:hypothetical protein
MQPLSSREKSLIGVIGALVVVLIVMLAMTLASSGPSLRIVSWYHHQAHSWEGPEIQVVFVVNVTNNGHAVGDATIRCEVQVEGNETYYATQVISLSPGEMKTYQIASQYFSDKATFTANCKLVTF